MDTIMTTKEILKRALLSGRSLTKFQFMDITPTHSVCLAQRVEELRRIGWKILDRPVKGKGNLVEYYLEKEEIERLHGIEKEDDEPVVEEKIVAPEPSNIVEEQMPLGLFCEYETIH